MGWRKGQPGDFERFELQYAQQQDQDSFHTIPSLGIEDVRTYEKDGEILILMGAIVTGHQAMVWSTPTEAALKMPALYARATQRYLRELESRPGLTRLYTLMNPKHEAAIRWIQWLGFGVEGVLRNGGRDGTDRVMYARIRSGDTWDLSY